MLHPLLALDENAFSGRHDSKLAHRALTDFIGAMSDGLDAYYTAVAKFADHLYGASLAESGATLFLDKTPRYYMILAELEAVFPQARFVFLLRNPAAVVTSIYSTWVKPNLPSMNRYAEDLLNAPNAMLSARESLGARAHTVQYETLLSRPDETVAGVYAFLGFSGAALGRDPDLPTFALGDQVNVYEYAEPQKSFGDRWKDKLDDPQLWRWVSEYVDQLGEETVAALGYEMSEIASALDRGAKAIPNDSMSLAQALRR